MLDYIYEFLYLAEYICWILTALTVIYLLTYTIAALFRHKIEYPRAHKQYRFAVIFPAYGEDRIILSSIVSFLKQDYPKNLFDVIVVSDHMEDTTNNQLAELPITLLKATYANSTKAKALNLAIDTLDKNKYDIVVILDADNIVALDFLTQINKVYNTGIHAIQAHRTAKNRNTDVAILDGISEEINNTIFRRGHVSLGMSSALIGSGMAFDYQWFYENVKKLHTVGEDKELEALLLKQRVFIEFLDEVYVYDEKIQDQKSFYKQRRRWIATQFGQWGRVFKDLPGALLSGNLDYSNKLFQWLMPPRVILLGGTITMGTIMTILDWPLALKWWGLFIIIGITLCLAIPNKMVDEKFKKSIRKVPILFLMMVINTLRIKGASQQFIHTEKTTKTSKI